MLINDENLEQILAKERDLINWFITLPEDQKSQIKTSYNLNPNAIEEILAIKFSLKQTKKKLKNSQEIIQTLESEQLEIKKILTDFVNKYDKQNYQHKVLTAEKDNIKKDLHKYMNLYDRSKFTVNKVLINHAVVMFELDRLFSYIGFFFLRFFWCFWVNSD